MNFGFEKMEKETKVQLVNEDKDTKELKERFKTVFMQKSYGEGNRGICRTQTIFRKTDQYLFIYIPR